MKKMLLMLVALLAFGVASAQTDKKTKPETNTQSEPQPLKKADGRLTAPDAKVPVTEKSKEVNKNSPAVKTAAPNTNSTVAPAKEPTQSQEKDVNIRN